MDPQIHTGDCRELCSLIPDHSVDLVFTDPPYLKEYLYLYEWLAEEIARVLKPGGFALVYAGEYHKNKIMRWMDERLEYFWDLAAVNYQGPGSMIWQRRIISKYKSILVYTLPGDNPKPRCNVLSVFNGSEYDKKYHVWQQDAATARYYVDCFSNPDDLVYDPFCGGGTTPFVCKILGRRCISFEIDKDQADIARARVEGARQVEFNFLTQMEMGL